MMDCGCLSPQMEQLQAGLQDVNEQKSQREAELQQNIEMVSGRC